MKQLEELLDSDGIHRVLMRISHQILEKNSETTSLAIIGMQSRGVFLAKELCANIQSIDGTNIPMGILDNTFYRDDYRSQVSQREPKVTDVPFDVSGKDIILVDDVLYTGRTVKAALDALFDLGRPRSVQLMVLVDRGHRELPIRADYIGKKMTTDLNQMVSYQVEELDGVTSLWLIEKEEN